MCVDKVEEGGARALKWKSPLDSATGETRTTIHEPWIVLRPDQRERERERGGRGRGCAESVGALVWTPVKLQAIDLSAEVRPLAMDKNSSR